MIVGWNENIYIQYSPKCDFFTSIFLEAEFLNSFQEFLHQILAP